MKPTTYDTSDEDQINAKARKSKSAEDNRIAGMLAAMRTKEGRCYFWNLLAQCGVYTSSFTACNAVTAFNEGRRNVGLAILADIRKYALKEYALMEQEANEKNV